MFLRLTKLKRSPQVLSLILEKPEGFSFYAGQYIDIALGETKDFTISSSPTEKFLMVTTNLSPSSFKKTLRKLQPGDHISISHPAGTFTLDEKSSAIFIAGGIGITPFRSIIKYALDQKLKTPITLIYSNSDDDFLFKDELSAWQKEYPHLKIIYHNSSHYGHLNVTKVLTAVDSLVNKIFYLAGAPGFVDDMSKILLEAGVDEINIRYDRFDGYD